MRFWFRRLRARWRYRHFQDDIAREIETHQLLKKAELERSGATEEEARRQAARELGNVTLARENARSVWIPAWLDGLWQDVRYVMRSSRRQPGFALTVVLILALGAGLVTAIFSVAYGTFLRPWPVPDPNRVVLVQPAPATTEVAVAGFSIPEFRYLEDHARQFLGLSFTVRWGLRPASYKGVQVGDMRPLFVSRGYLDTMRPRLLAGRGFRDDEHDDGSPTGVVVISRGLWHRALGGNPGVVGQSLQLGGQTFTIVGIADVASFAAPYANASDAILPLAALALTGREADRRQFSDPRVSDSRASVAGRLRPGVAPGQAAAELTTLSRQFREAEHLPPLDVSLVGTRLISQIDAALQNASLAPGAAIGLTRWQALEIAFLALLLVHLLACANAGNLLLARGLSRQRELAIRQALGAGRGRIVRQLFVEGLALSAVAGAFALAVASVVPPIVAERLTGLPGDYTLDGPVLGFCLALVILTALGAGLAPALRSASRSIHPLTAGNQSPSLRAMELRRVLLAMQVALATALLAGAGLLTRAVTHAETVDPGFAIKELLILDLRLPLPFSGPRNVAFFRDLHAALNQPGASAVAFSDRPPFSDSNVYSLVRRPDGSDPARMLRRIDVSENYFDVTGVSMLDGRPPNALRPREVVLSARAARELWPDAPTPIGKTLHHVTGSGREDFEALTVVGVAEDASVKSMTDFEPSIYWQTTLVQTSLLVRNLSRGVVDRVSSVASALLPGTTVTSQPLSDRIRPSLESSIARSRLAWAISALGLLLATIGAFGVFAYAVEERKREIGIRLALGARRAHVIRAVWSTSQRAMLIGLVAGGALAAGGAQLLRRFLHGLSPFDPLAYAQIAIILIAAGALATWLPARRAARVDPAVTLKAE